MKIYFLSILGAVIFMASCSKDTLSPVGQEGSKIVLTPDEYISITNDNPKDLNEDKVLANLTEFLKNFNQTQASRSSSPLKLSVRKKYYYSQDGSRDEKLLSRSTQSEAINPLIYEVEVSEGTDKSLAIISADCRTPNVVYVGPAPEDVDTEEGVRSILFMSAMGKASIVEDIEKVETAKCLYREKTLRKIADQLNIPVNQVDVESLEQNIIVEGRTGSRYDNPLGGLLQDSLGFIKNLMGPLSPIAWAQSRPYNHEMQNVKWRNSFTGQDEQRPALTGCANVALAQIFAMLEVPIQGCKLDGTRFPIDWTIAKRSDCLQWAEYGQTSPQDEIDQVAGLMRQLFLETNSIIQYSGGYHNATGTPEADIQRVLGNYCNFEGSILRNPNTITYFSANKAQQSLMRNRPLLLVGEIVTYDSKTGEEKGERVLHVIVIDGLATTDGSPNWWEYNYYYRVNMGWGNKDEYTRPAFFKSTYGELDKVQIVYQGSNGVKQMNTWYMTMLHNISRK